MDASKPNILVVDDEMGPRESLKMILNPYYNVLVADRGAQTSAIEYGDLEAATRERRRRSMVLSIEELEA